jgi:hypothetical protein
VCLDLPADSGSAPRLVKVFLGKFGDSEIHHIVRRSRGGPGQACTAGSAVKNPAMAKLRLITRLDASEQ